jgi:hypothetical protein
VAVSVLSRIRLFCSCHFSKSQSERPVYQEIRRCRATKIVELDIGSGELALGMIDVAKLVSPDQEIHYVGLDPFEGRSETDSPGLTLKAAHQLLRRNGVRVQLVPGNPADSLIRVANSLGKVDVLILPAALDSTDCARTWFFIPRMLHEESVVFVSYQAEDGESRLELKPHSEIAALATQRRQAA